MPLERDFQPKFIKRLKREFPGGWAIKLDSGYMQGIPDWLFLYRNYWAVLEIKRKRPTKPSDWEENQEWYLEEFDSMSFAACVYPENEEEVINDLKQAFRVGR